jgi:hypothetical protein
MVERQHLESVPLFALTYAILGLLYTTRGRDKLSGAAVQSLGYVFILIGFLNGYVESWNRYGQALNFELVIAVLVIASVLIYANFVIDLSELRLRQDRNRAVISTYMPAVALLIVGIGFASIALRHLENPPLGFYSFLTLAFVIHVPLFLAGRSQLVQATVGKATDHDIVLAFWERRKLLLLVCAPLAILLVIQIAIQRDDWRLFYLDAATTLAFGCLIFIATGQDRLDTGNIES